VSKLERPFPTAVLGRRFLLGKTSRTIQISSSPMSAFGCYATDAILPARIASSRRWTISDFRREAAS
jgi:hypothetical protein